AQLPAESRPGATPGPLPGMANQGWTGSGRPNLPPVFSPAGPTTVAPPALVPVPPEMRQATGENLMTFDPRLAELHWVDNRWQLEAGGVFLKDFGRRENEARQVLHLVRELRLTERGTVGTPQPVMEYWLANGQAPQGSLPGLRLLPLDLASLHVEPIQGQ